MSSTWNLWCGLKRFIRNSNPYMSPIVSQPSDKLDDGVEQQEKLSEALLVALRSQQQQQSLQFNRLQYWAQQQQHVGAFLSSFHTPVIPAVEKPRKLVAGPLVGHRYFMLTSNGELKSINNGYTWTASPARACCQPSPQSRYGAGLHAAPVSGCSCGYWAFKELPTTDELSGYPLTSGAYWVTGRVALWGVRTNGGGGVIPTENGYRAEYAHPLSLVYYRPMPGWPPAPPEARQALELARQRYGCEIEAEP